MTGAYFLPFFLPSPQNLRYTIPGLEISTCKLAKCEWFFEVASLKNILQQTFASQVPSFASKKNLTSKTLLVDKKVKFEPCIPLKLAAPQQMAVYIPIFSHRVVLAANKVNLGRATDSKVIRHNFSIVMV